MRQRRAVATFFLALFAFVATGGGVVLLVAPESGEAARRSASVRSPSPLPAPAAAAAPAEVATALAGPAEFTLVENAPAIARPDQPGRLVIPSIALDARVVEVGIVIENGKLVWDTAAYAVGFHRGTALPGTRGNAVMAGHISSPMSGKGEVFRRLPELRIGDRVEVYIGERRVIYEVTELRVVPPTAIHVMNPTEDATLTLITCYPDRLYSKRLVVVGKLVSV